MTENHYSMLVLWSEDDEAFLAHVVELPGCIAHGETRELAVKNCLSAIENWIETAEELKRDIPTPVDVTAFEKMTAQQTQDVRNLFDQAVQKAVSEALARLGPEVAKHIQNVLAIQQQSSLVSIYRGGARVGGVLPTTAEDLELHKR